MARYKRHFYRYDISKRKVWRNTEAPFSKYKASMLKGAMPKRKFLLSDRFSTPL